MGKREWSLQGMIANLNLLQKALGDLTSFLVGTPGSVGYLPKEVGTGCRGDEGRLAWPGKGSFDISDRRQWVGTRQGKAVFFQDFHFLLFLGQDFRQTRRHPFTHYMAFRRNGRHSWEKAIS